MLHLSANVSFADVTGRHARGGMAQEAIPVGASGARGVRVRPVGLATFRSWLRSVKNFAKSFELGEYRLRHGRPHEGFGVLVMGGPRRH